MINTKIGRQLSLNGRKYLETEIGKHGHAVYGPYEYVSAGNYKAIFEVAAMNMASGSDSVNLGRIDVAADAGRKILAFKDFSASDIQNGYLTIDFSIASKEKVEYRLYTNGAASIRVAQRRAVINIDGFQEESNEVSKALFPNPDNFESDSVFRQHLSTFGSLYDHGASISVADSSFHISLNNVTINVSSFDDLRFLSDILINNEYNILPCRPSILIDIGMNIGVTSLFLANKYFVQEVYAFEPFTSTYNRALYNISLNPDVADKIRAFNYGIAARDGLLQVSLKSDSGANSIFSVENPQEESTQIEVREASNALAPIIGSAVVRDLGIIMKVDCEGSEFDIFSSLAHAGLFEHVDALLVEWHSVLGDKDNYDLFRPLQSAGFIIFDLTNRLGKKFFYAARTPHRHKSHQ